MLIEKEGKQPKKFSYCYKMVIQVMKEADFDASLIVMFVFFSFSFTDKNKQIFLSAFMTPPA